MRYSGTGGEVTIWSCVEAISKAYFSSCSSMVLWRFASACRMTHFDQADFWMIAHNFGVVMFLYQLKQLPTAVSAD
jgi:hypothetical protein